MHYYFRFLLLLLFPGWLLSCQTVDTRPNMILLMADDQGWGQTGYYSHPILKTPNLDSMAENGLRFDRFYAGASNCSPTRATVLTGRSNDRTGVFNHGFPLRSQERTLAEAFRDAGYATAHFGKWHLNGLRGPGAPILATDPLSPGHFGFDFWLSATNFIDRDPLLSQKGQFRDFEGDSSEVIVEEAVRFIREKNRSDQPFLVVVWFGTPHSPWRAGEKDRRNLKHLSEREQNHYGELIAMDRSIGFLRSALREMKIEKNTLVWYCSDNGGLEPFGPETVGGLRGWKNTMYEGGLRVPAIIEWPGGIRKPRATSYPASTLDIFPTLVEIAGLPSAVMLQPQDGISLVPVFNQTIEHRSKPIPFRHQDRGVLIDNDLKFLWPDIQQPVHHLYNLAEDPTESTDISEKSPFELQRLKELFEAWNRSVEASVAGEDYPEGRLLEPKATRRFWIDDPDYEPYLKIWINRPEYEQWIQRRLEGN